MNEKLAEAAVTGEGNAPREVNPQYDLSVAIDFLKDARAKLLTARDYIDRSGSDLRNHPRHRLDQIEAEKLFTEYRRLVDLSAKLNSSLCRVATVGRHIA